MHIAEVLRISDRTSYASQNLSSYWKPELDTDFRETFFIQSSASLKMAATNREMDGIFYIGSGHGVRSRQDV